MTGPELIAALVAKLGASELARRVNVHRSQVYRWLESRTRPAADQRIRLNRLARECRIARVPEEGTW